MKGASWNECIENNFVIKISPDFRRAKSLIETSEERLSIIKEINEKTCNFVFEDYYTSLLELLQALVLIKGYKILNHVCLGFYLKDVLKKDDLYLAFDDLRFKRNFLTYYGKRMDLETCKEAIRKCKKIINEIKELIESS